jgi:hypothetical protein
MYFLLLFMLSLQQNWRRRQNRFCLKARVVGERGRRQGVGGEKWLKQCMHIWINKKIGGFLSIAQWYSTYLACARPWFNPQHFEKKIFSLMKLPRLPKHTLYMRTVLLLLKYSLMDRTIIHQAIWKWCRGVSESLCLDQTFRYLERAVLRWPTVNHCWFLRQTCLRYAENIPVLLEFGDFEKILL